MSDGQRAPPRRQIVVSGLTKQYKNVRAVDDLSFTVEPGRVTGFLGPNGAGKTTTLRMLLNLVTPTAGTATIGGQRYADLHRPAAARRRGPGGVQRAQGPHRPQPPADDLRRGRAARAPRRRGARAGRADPGGEAQVQGLLAGHEAAARHRRRACSATRGC